MAANRSHIDQKLASPAFPIAPNEYNQIEQSQFRDILRIFFNRIIALLNFALEYSRPEIITETSTSWTLTGKMDHDYILCDNTSPIQVFAPNDTAEDLPVGFAVTLFQETVTGQITVVGEPGVSLTSANGFSTASQYSELKLVKIEGNNYRITGDTV
jgi:hypothetical protein